MDDQEERAAVIEIKRARVPEELPGKAAEALRQIREKKYGAPLEVAYAPVFHWGFAFCRKGCLALFEDPDKG